jgi:isopentenyl diphosphate isomerase/L-lactate dehydrogenase-like FMN-dependent dehydrogenase
MDPVNVPEYERRASERVDPAAWDYIQGGAADERTLRSNTEAFDAITLLPRVLVDVSCVETETRVLGRPVRFPVLAAPTGFQTLAHPEGELAVARATAALGTIMVLSTLSSYPLEAVAAAAAGPKWFQLYCYRDRSVTQRLVERAQEQGFHAICVTVDLPAVGHRERDLRSGFTLPPHALPRNFEGLVDTSAMSDPANPSVFAEHIGRLVDPSLTWEIIPWLRSVTHLPIVLKGILRPDDARHAADRGIDGIIVSNHGGRQLDGVPASIEALPPIVEAVRGQLDILLDGGIRRGTDVAKALALGARAVLVGRPVLWGLAVGGAKGVERVLDLLRAEFALAMTLLGCRNVAELNPGLLGTA